MSEATKRSRLAIATPLLAGLAAAAACFAAYVELAEDYSLSPKIIAFDAKLGALIVSWRTPRNCSPRWTGA